MNVKTYELNLNTMPDEVVDITKQVSERVRDSGIKNGVVTIFVASSTSAVTVMEYEPGLKKDLPMALDRIFPKTMEYYHEEMWHDGNGYSHVRASFLKPDLTVPIIDSRMSLGTWQQIVFLELDNKKRSRKIVLQIMGE